MPKLTEATQCYIAWRKHPTLGLLVKIGSSQNPRSRCSSIGARILGVLPYAYERRLLYALAGNEAWPRYNDWRRKTHPIFAGQSEWFFATEDVVKTIILCVKGSL